MDLGWCNSGVAALQITGNSIVFASLYWLKSNKTLKLCITGRLWGETTSDFRFVLKATNYTDLHYWPFVRGINPWPTVPPRKRPVVRKAFLCHASLCILTSNPMDVGDYHNRTRCATLRPRQNGHHFPDDIFKHIFWNDNARNPIKNWLKFVLYCPINNNSAFAQLMPCRRSGDKP